MNRDSEKSPGMSSRHTDTGIEQSQWTLRSMSNVMSKSLMSLSTSLFGWGANKDEKMSMESSNVERMQSEAAKAEATEDEYEKCVAEAYPYAPNEHEPSDHFSLVADLEFMPTKEDIQRTVTKIKGDA